VQPGEAADTDDAPHVEVDTRVTHGSEFDPERGYAAPADGASAGGAPAPRPGQ
jgi:hypothetical protein